MRSVPMETSARPHMRAKREMIARIPIVYAVLCTRLRLGQAFPRAALVWR